MWSKLLVAGALVALLVSPAATQNAPDGTPTRIRGTVEKLDGQTLTVKSREGPQLTIALSISRVRRTAGRAIIRS